MIKKIKIRTLIIYLLLCFFSIVAIGPTLWIFSCALKSGEEIYAYPPSIIPKHPTLENFVKLQKIRVGQGNMITATSNGLIVALFATFICLTISTLGGYGLSRMRSPLKSKLLFFIFFVQLVPTIVLTIPLYVWFADLGLIDKLIGLIVAYQSFLVPISIAFVKDYIDSVPVELEEAALVDGCSRFWAFIKISLPLSAPSIASVAIFAFLHAWEEYLLASVLILTPDKRTPPLQLAAFIGEYMIDWGGIMAGAIWVLLPVIIVFLLLQKYFVAGLTTGAVKA